MTADIAPDVVRRILDFWFSERDETGLPAFRKAWFTKDSDFDEAIREGFAADVEAAAAGNLDTIAGMPDGALALLILLDQFPRNLFRGTARAFATDTKARSVARRAIADGFDRTLPKAQRMFFYLPFEHSESLADQEWCVAFFESLGDAELLKWAIVHRDIVARFGRFPHRNDALGRDSTDEERAFLEEPNSSF